MQLFITKFQKRGDTIIINNKEILDQVRKVLRMKIGDDVFVQDENERFHIKINNRDNETMTGDILDVITGPIKNDKVGMLISMSNKRDKMEVIVQKLSEIGIKKIYFWPSERSIIREWNEKRIDRLNKIAKEAVEQSRGWLLPEICFEKNISRIIEGKKIIIFDKSDKDVKFPIDKDKNTKIVGIIGPEGGLTKGDYDKFGEQVQIVGLGETILRTETASIVASRLLLNKYDV